MSRAGLNKYAQAEHTRPFMPRLWLDSDDELVGQIREAEAYERWRNRPMRRTTSEIEKRLQRLENAAGRRTYNLKILDVRLATV